MSRLVSRILLTTLLFPLAALVYLVAYLAAYRLLAIGYDTGSNVLSGVVTWAFMAIYWCFLWYRDVRWTSERILRTTIAAGAAVIAGIAIGGAVGVMEDDVGAFVGSAAAPLLWLVATTILWRDGTGEAATRGGEGGAVVCPSCAYNLAGLTEARCPECGVRYTLDELFARQPGKEANELTAGAAGPRDARTRRLESPA